jgi:1-acyl-sn-glycerol-3-phosphate acyltransferase
VNTPENPAASDLVIENATPGKNAWFRVAASIVRPTMHVLGRIKWYGQENLPKEGGIIVAANHASYVDPLMMAHYLYVNGRPPRILAKESLFRVPVLGFFLRKLAMIPVFRGSARAKESLEIADMRLAQGFCIAVYPEGTLTKDPNGWPMQGHTGVARMALMTKAPVIPLGQWGQLDLMPQGAKMLKLFPRKTLTVEAGKPVDLSDLYDKEIDSALLREATDRIMRAITEIVAKHRGEVPPATFFVPSKG